jgi:large subunit ribosomal protein L21
MYAIFRTGGRQFRAEIGGEFNVEKLPHEVGDKIDFDEVLLIAGNGSPVIGKPLVKGAKVKATIVEQLLGKKIIVWKYRPRKRYRRKYGHRQYYTRLRIDDIVPGKSGKAAEAAKAPAKPAEKPAAKKEVAPEEAAPSAPSTRKSLANVGVSERQAELLAEGGIKTVSAFIKALDEGGDAAVLAIKGFGPKGLEEVKQVLTDAGYELPE